MDRFHAFEFNDSGWCPPFLRDGIVEALGKCLRWGRIYDQAAPIFRDFCCAAGSDTILDLCSGSGDSVAALLDAMAKQHISSPNFVLSDLFPRLHALKDIAAHYPGKIKVIDEPVNAADVPDKYDRPARTIISAFHHFPPEIATGILSDCVQKRQSIFILEPFTRNIREIMPLLLPYTIASLANPLLTKQDRLLKLISSFPVPFMPMLALWDGIISIFRVYTKDDLMKMVAPFKNIYHWEYHKIPIHLGGTVTAFFGVPKK